MPETAQLSDAKRKLLTKYLSGKAEVKRATSNIPRRIPSEPIPLSYAQEQVWLHAQMAPDVPLYNEPVTIHYTGILDVSVLEGCFNEILRRHEAWRTCFVTVDGVPVQKVEPNITLSLPVIDLRNLSEQQRESEALRIATEDARKSLDLAQAPLFRANLIRLKDEEHRLYLTLSHIIFDGVAIYRVFLPELSKLYEAFTSGEPSPLPDPPIQHGDFCAWQRQSLSLEKLAEDLEYWRGQLDTGPSPLELPADRPRPPIQTFRGSMYPFVLSPGLSDAIRQLCRQESITPFQLLLAGFAVLLQRYSGDEQIRIGSVTAGRDYPETELLLGYFLNTVALRADLRGDPTFREVAKRMRSLTLEALKHDAVPFGELIQQFNRTRDYSRNPLFDVMFSLEPPMPEVKSGWRLTQMDVDSGASKYDLYLELDERRNEILARFHYSTDLFDLATIERMAGHWTTLLEAATRAPELHISELPLLTAEERRQFAEWNDTIVDYPRDLCVHQLFEVQSQRTPDAVALLFAERKVTYRQLNERSNQMAHHLQKLGVASGSVVGVCVERSIDMVVAVLGVLKAGGAYVPLDPSYPRDRLAFMLLDSGADVLVTQNKLSGKFPESHARHVFIDADWEKIACEKTESALSETKAENAAYVMYTSGSTGLPKGVMGTHRATVNRLSWMCREYPFQTGEICSQKTSLSFVDSVWEIFGPLLAGVPNVIIPDESVKKVDAMIETLAANRVTRIVLVPSLLRAMMTVADLHIKLHNLKLWISSGEALPRDLALSFMERMPGHTLLNLYGSTEVAADATYYEISPSDRWFSVPIGKPIANAQAHVLDARLQPVPVNVQGEIYIGGDAVSLGYWKRPELTSERFIPDRFSQSPAARLYRTGDLGRHLPDGNIEYLGRRDHQVKVRGFRIELGEIEAALGNYSAVRQCVVVAREDESGDKRLVAYFEPVAGLQFTMADIRAHLKAQLPEHMIPAAIVPMDALPLTPSGKIDRKTLPDTLNLSLERRTAFAAPRDKFERILAQIWSRVLRVSLVGVHDNFFELGGHSLLAVRIMAEIDNVFKRRLPLATLVQTPTIAELAGILRNRNWMPSWASLVPIQTAGSRSPLFLVHGAEGNILLYRHLAQYLGPDQPVYGLQSQGLNGEGHLSRTIHEMAAQYVKEVMAIQPHGPYLLGGYCLGGIVAFEMAQQLSALKEQVEMVLMLDTYNPSVTSSLGLRLKAPLHFLQNLWFHGANLILINPEERRRFLREKVDTELARLRIRLQAAYHSVKRRDSGTPRDNYPHLAVKNINDKAWLQYVPRPYAGRVVFIESKGHFMGLSNPSSGWNSVVREGLEVHELPSYPKGMLLEPFCRSLAETLRPCLQ